VPAPILCIRGDHAVRGYSGKPQPARGGECLMSSFAGPKLGVEILGAAEVQSLFQEIYIA
jgi:hypothetical protein